METYGNNMKHLKNPKELRQQMQQHHHSSRAALRRLLDDFLAQWPPGHRIGTGSAKPKKNQLKLRKLERYNTDVYFFNSIVHTVLSSQHRWDFRYILDFQRTNIVKHPQTKVNQSNFTSHTSKSVFSFSNSTWIMCCITFSSFSLRPVTPVVPGAGKPVTPDSGSMPLAWEVQATALEPHTRHQECICSDPK